MKIFFSLRTPAALLLLALLAAPALPLGCTALDSLCTKRLYLYRDTKEKSLPPADMALLITDPALLAYLMPEAASKVILGLPWAQEQPEQQSDVYRLSIERLDGRAVYQGLCLDVTPTFVCEVRPGPRNVSGRLDLFGVWGHEGLRDNASLNLAPGGVYFFHPDWQGVLDKKFSLQADPLPLRYDAALRARLMDWLRRHTKGRSLEN